MIDSFAREAAIKIMSNTPGYNECTAITFTPSCAEALPWKALFSQIHALTIYGNFPMLQNAKECNTSSI